MLDVATNGIGKKQFTFSSESLREHIQLEETSSNSDRLLWQICRTQKEETETLLSLRCRVSHPLLEKVRILFNQFKDKYELDFRDMLICVLDDTGDLFLRLPKKKEDGRIETVRKTFSWPTLKELSSGQIKPFGADIIYSFDPDLSGLSTWAKNKVQANAELKAYLKSCGILLISPWALIADSTPTRVKNAWERCGDGDLVLKDIESLHSSYLKQYKQAKELYKKSTGKISGWVPDSSFLSSLKPPQKDRNGLLAIDKAIRQYLAGTSFTRQFEEGEEAQIETPLRDSDEDSSTELIKLIQQSLERSATPIVKNVINADRAKWDKDPSRKLAWELYSQGLSQRDIASRCEHKQAWVSKLLSEKTLSEKIAQEAAVELIRRPEFQPVRKDPQGVDRMIEQLRNYLFSSEQEEKVPLLRQIIHEVLNQ